MTRAGAERAAHFVAEFDPAYERLEVHFIRVRRGDDFVEHAKPGAFQTFRRETNLERLVLNGRLTASLLIPDVRVDDIIEVGITMYGSNPVLGGLYAGWVAFDPFNPFLEVRHRLVRPPARKVSVKEFNDPPPREVAVMDGVEDSVWRMVGQKRRENEELTPPWRLLAPALQFSEFSSWNDVARLFAPFYESAVIPDALAAEIDQLAAVHEDPAEFAAEWLRFVQQRLRYFALSFGEGGFVPRGLEAIWASRLGDCKDAAQLYIAGARRTGLDTCAVLVSTTHGMALDSLLPSSNVFNHCIVRLRLYGVSYWLDPTIQTQSGSLDHIFHPHTGWALPLALETVQLEKLGNEAPLHCLDLQDEIRFGPKRESPATLHRYIDHYFWAADFVRGRLANEGTNGYAKDMFQANWPGIVETAPVEIRDDPVKNCFTTVLTYEIRDCWKPAGAGRLSFGIADVTVAGELAPLRGTQRQADIYLGRPRKTTHVVRMDMPCRWAGHGWFHEHQAPGVTYSNRLDMEGRTIVSSKELVVDAWSMPAGQAKAYHEVVGKLRENVLAIWGRERFGKIRPLTGGTSGISATAWIVIMVAWLLFMLARVLHLQ
jgi:hypothetical protein